MSDSKHEADRRVQSNRHLKERNENLRLEQQSHYALKAKHKQEQEQLRFKASSETGIELKKRQAHEVNSLRYRQSQIRIALEKQQTQEIATFTSNLLA